MGFTSKDIQHLADLSALEFTEKEIERFAKEFEQINDFVCQIQKADISAELVYDKIIPLEDLREDIAKPSLPNDVVLLNAPKKAKGAFAVPLMMED